MGVLSAQFRSSAEQDSHEFLSAFLNGLHEELKVELEVLLPRLRISCVSL
jgi:ubiquitin C-terminal hydrolase